MNRILVLILVLQSLNAFSQSDFNHYSPLVSKGVIPVDFTKQTYVKIENDTEERTDLKRIQERIFLEGSNYAIDEILHSGIVVYGDVVSNYIGQVADLMLNDDWQLRNKLRFYTIKSNVANAFSTDQGIIFVTTGLIAQLTNEAQLAYILSHEIAHFTEKHVVETFDLATSREMRNYDRINKLSQHSKENELEADQFGITRYHKLGYSKNEILSTFDVLMYSYLPFDEIEFPSNYFNSPSFHVPINLFPNKQFDIRAIENYDDSKSSHPNIKTRKEAALVEMGKHDNWGDSKYLLNDQKFKEIRNICRFEGVRCDILEANYGDGLYSIFILEKEFPQSDYLKRMKAQLWLNLLNYKIENISARAIDKTSELEGESAKLHYLLKQLNKDAMSSMALRQIYDIYKDNKDVDELKKIYHRLIEVLAKYEKFKPEHFSKKSFEQASLDFLASQTDTVKEMNNASDSKYDRIKNKKNLDNAISFDSTKFYFYGMYDIVSDTEFLENFQKAKDQQENEKKRKEEYNLMSRSERREYHRKEKINTYAMSMHDVLVVEPMVLSYRFGEIDYLKSEKLEENFSLAISDPATMTSINAHIIDSRSLETKGTQGYNERSILMTLLEQVANEDDIHVFPVDYELLKTIRNDFGTNRVMFSLVEHSYSPNITFTGIFSSILFYPVLMAYIPAGLMTGSNTELNIVILDLDKGIVEKSVNYYFKDSPRRIQLGAHMYDLFKKFSSETIH